jgi:hypothetical protein
MARFAPQGGGASSIPTNFSNRFAKLTTFFVGEILTKPAFPVEKSVLISWHSPERCVETGAVQYCPIFATQQRKGGLLRTI